MSKLTEQLRTIKIFNSHYFAGSGNVYIEYSPAGDSRSLRCAGFRVIRPGYKTDPDAHWMDNGYKTFTGNRKSGAFEKAKAWASERYGIKEWARTPYGSWMDAEFVKRRLAELKAQLPK